MKTVKLKNIEEELGVKFSQETEYFYRYQFKRGGPTSLFYNTLFDKFQWKNHLITDDQAHSLLKIYVKFKNFI